MTAHRDADAYEAGLRAGYAHGYEIGRAHGRAELDDELPAVDMPVRPAGPRRDELVARGHIPMDRTRPPALPARLWDADDWAKADERDLPTTESGRAQWQAAVAAGRVPPRLAAVFAADGTGYVRRGDAAEVAESVTRAVADADRAIAALRARLAAAPADRAVRTPAAVGDDLERDREIGR